MHLPHSPLVYFAFGWLVLALFAAYGLLQVIWKEEDKPIPTLSRANVVAAVRVAADFERTMLSINLNAGATVRQINRLAIKLRLMHPWLEEDPVQWRWPLFSASPQRPFDWRID